MMLKLPSDAFFSRVAPAQRRRHGPTRRRRGPGRERKCLRGSTAMEHFYKFGTFSKSW